MYINVFILTIYYNIHNIRSAILNFTHTLYFESKFFFVFFCTFTNNYYFFSYTIGIILNTMNWNSILGAWLYSAGYRWSEHWNNQSFFLNFPFPTTIARAGNVPLRERVASVVAKNHNAQNSVQKGSLYSICLVFSLS